MTLADRWTLFADLWPISLTMVAGSFVAGATPGGGAAVALPVFTKILKIPTTDAAHFGLMIQAVGMMMSSVMILVKRVPVLPKVIIWTTVGGFYGIVMGDLLDDYPGPVPQNPLYFCRNCLWYCLDYLPLGDQPSAAKCITRVVFAKGSAICPDWLYWRLVCLKYRFGTGYGDLYGANARLWHQ